MPRLRIGLTGGIGSGKSTVALTLAEAGATVIDSDAISRRLSAAGGAAIEPLRRAFGADFIDAAGALDRARMRALAFAEPDARRRLEAILHPLIGERIAEEARRTPDATLVFDVPLLVESGRWRALVDRVWVVDCSEQTQRERVMRRSGWTADAVDAAIRSQASRPRRRAAADDVIFNDGITPHMLADLVRRLLQRFDG